MPKIRIDKLLLEKGLAQSREKAQAMILAGNVLANEVLVTKPGKEVDDAVKIRLKNIAPLYVSRGGLKLEEAIKKFNIDVNGKTCLDVGASTGGFTDCLLKNGAARVYAVDVGRGQLAWKLRQDNRVVAIEKANIRHLGISNFDERIDLVTIDVSFISLKKVFPAVDKIISCGAIIVALIKPQFEVGRDKVGKGGIVRNREYQVDAVEDVCRSAEGLGWLCKGRTESPIDGAKGNKEFLVLFQK